MMVIEVEPVPDAGATVTQAAELEVSPEDAGQILSRIDTVREELHVRRPERPEEYLRKLTARYHNAAGA